MVKSDKESLPLRIPGYKHIQNTALIPRLEGDGNYTRLYVAHQRDPLLISQTLSRLEPLLPGFIRIHKSALINPQFVRELIDEGSKQLQVVLTDSTILTVSRRRIDETKARLFHYRYDGTKRIWLFGQPFRTNAVVEND